MVEVPLALILALLFGLGAVCQWLAWRLRLPAILFLLLCGLALGPGLGWLDPDAMLGDLLFPVVSLGVAVILFEGSLTLRWREARGAGRMILHLSSIGVVVTWTSLAVAAHYIVGLSWSVAALFGAIGSVTGPTVVMPMLRSIRPSSRVANVLRWEGILVDPIGALLAVLVYEVISSGQQTDSVRAFALAVGAGVVCGGAGAWFLGTALRRHWFPEYLINYVSLALVLVSFTVANQIEHESGLLAVTIMGLILANMRGVHLEEILDFKEDLSVVLISMMFIVLAARLDWPAVQSLGWGALGLLAFAQLVARPLSVAVSSIGTGIQRNEALLVAWVAPRGIVAAAVSSLFALRLGDFGIAGGEALVGLCFVLIIGTVVLQSATAGWLARALGQSRADAQGVLIIGANQVSLAIAQALKRLGIEVLIADDHWDAINEARMAGVPTYFGNPLSEHAEMHMDLSGMTRLFLMSRRPEHDALAFTRFRPDFGPKHIYALGSGSKPAEQREMSASLRARPLFGDRLTWSKLAWRLAHGEQIKATRLTPEFELSAYFAAYGDDAMILFALTPEGRLRVVDDPAALAAREGWTLVALAAAPGRDSETGN